jgi:hypothetical protein
VKIKPYRPEPFYGEPMSGHDVALWALDSFRDAEAAKSKNKRKEIYERLGHLYAGRLSTGEELEYLRDTDRPDLDINLTRQQVEAMTGLYLAESREIAFEGIGMDSGDQVLAEFFRRVVRRVWQRGKFHSVLGTVARDLFYFGEGHVEIYLDTQARKPLLKLCRVPWIEAYPDPASKEPNYADKQFFLRRREYTLETAMAMYPDAKDLLISSAYHKSGDGGRNFRPAPLDVYGPHGSRFRSRSSVTLLDFQYWRSEPIVVLTSSAGRFEVGKGQAREAARAIALAYGEEPTEESKASRKYYRSIVVDGAPEEEATILTIPLGDVQWLTYSATGYPDEDINTGEITYFGLGKHLYKQQEWLTRVLRTQLDYMGRAAKGLTEVQTGAVADMEIYRRDSARPEGIVEVVDLNGIKHHDPAPAGGAMTDFVQFLISSFSANGVNDSMRGAVSTYRSGSFVQNQSTNAERGLLSLIARMAELEINLGIATAKLVQDPRVVDDEQISRILEPAEPILGLTHEMTQDPTTGEETMQPIVDETGQEVTVVSALRETDVLEYDVATDLGQGSVAERQMVAGFLFQDGFLGQLAQLGVPIQGIVADAIEITMQSGTFAKRLSNSIRSAFEQQQAATSEEGMIESLKAMGPEAAQQFLEKAMTEVIGANAPQPNAQ